MDIQKLSDSAIAGVVERYRRQGKTEGGPYSLAELLMEQRRRKPTAFPVIEVAQTILELSHNSSDHLVTYKEIWDHFRPTQPWLGHGSQRPVRDALYRVVGYCAANELPIITVLVVRSQSRKLSAQAVQNIYVECKELGIDVGLDPEAFVRHETERSLALRSEELPDD